MPLVDLGERITACRACPRLVAWREQVAREKRAAYRGEDYWGRPVPGFGDARARVLLIGLAPAAHGGNRTGRVFTGDRSGDWLFAGLHRAGFANQPTSRYKGDGLALTDCYIAACVRCAPPDNKPTTEERDHCLGFLVEELRLLRQVKVIVCLGAFAWDGVRTASRASGTARRRPWGRTRCWDATTRASKTRSRGGSPRRCSTRCWNGRGDSPAERRATRRVVS
jgi:uracil-DNA glycosylase